MPTYPIFLSVLELCPGVNTFNLRPLKSAYLWGEDQLSKVSGSAGLVSFLSLYQAEIRQYNGQLYIFVMCSIED